MGTGGDMRFLDLVREAAPSVRASYRDLELSFTSCAVAVCSGRVQWL